MDVGNFSKIYRVQVVFIQNVEDRQSYKIGCIEEIALNNKWINKTQIKNRIKFCANTNYSKYLKNLISK